MTDSDGAKPPITPFCDCGDEADPLTGECDECHDLRELAKMSTRAMAKRLMEDPYE